MRANLIDSFNITSSREITGEGYLKATAALTCTGVQKYILSDITGNVNDTNMVNVFRSKNTIFDKLTISSAKLKPITMQHPSDMVTSGNHHNLAVGTIGENVRQLDDERLGASIIITNKNIVSDIMANKISNISLGYSAEFKKEKGVFNGQHYDYVFDGAMCINHGAIVQKGRCGNSVKILDGDVEMKNEELTAQIKALLLKDTDIIKPQIKALLLKDTDIISALVASVADAKKKEIKNEDLDKKDVVDSSKKTKDSGEQAEASIEKNSNNPAGKTDSSIKDTGKEVKTLNDSVEINNRVNTRLSLLHKAAFLTDADLSDLSNRQILDRLFKDKTDRSHDYLMGILDSSIVGKEKAASQLRGITDSYQKQSGAQPRMYTALEIKNL